MNQSIDSEVYVTYVLDIMFVGTSFHGWQSQTDGNTIQNKIEKALTTFLRHDVRVNGASRTDSGVHAESFTATFATPQKFDEYTWIQSLSALLPPEIAVGGISKAPQDFHPIKSAKAKAYRYRVWMKNVRHPMLAPFVWQVSPQLDVDLLRQAITQFEGTHDFTSFCASNSNAKTHTRKIFEIKVLRHADLLDIWVIGEGFLKQMVRNLAGTAVEVGLGKRSPDEISGILEAKDRTKAGQTAPAQGLSLVKVFYDQIPTVESLATQASQGFTLSLS